MTTEKSRDPTGAIAEMSEEQLDIVSGGGGQASIGSQSSGGGAGKVSFNPFSITRTIDRSSPTFFNN